MKQVFCILLIFACMLSFVGCETQADTKNPDASQTNPSTSSSPSNTSEPDESLRLSNAILYDDHAVLPLCDVLTGLGFSLAWEDSDRATFWCNKIQYVISLSEKTLTEEGKDDNYLICPPGNFHYVCDVIDGSLMVDDNTVHVLFSTFLHAPIKISVNREENHVTISKK